MNPENSRADPRLGPTHPTPTGRLVSSTQSTSTSTELQVLVQIQVLRSRVQVQVQVSITLDQVQPKYWQCTDNGWWPHWHSIYIYRLVELYSTETAKILKWWWWYWIMTRLILAQFKQLNFSIKEAEEENNHLMQGQW